MTSTIASTLEALSNVGKASVVLRLTGTVCSTDVISAAVARHSQLLALDSDGSLTIQSGADAWGTMRDFGHEVLEALMQTE